MVPSSDPKSMTNHRDYSTLGPIGFIAWVQKEHSKFIRDHEWPALASKLSESNNAMILTCYNCGENVHIKPNCPKLNDCHHTSNVTPTMTPEGPPPAPNVNPPPTLKAVVEKKDGERVRRRIAAWKRIRPFDITVAHIDNDGKEWKFCTKCTDKPSGKQGFFNLSHFDADHKDGFRHPTPAANLTMLGDPLDSWCHL
jgi:hypothetical protein